MTIQLFRNHLRNTFVTVGYKVTAKKSVGGIEADDVDQNEIRPIDAIQCEYWIATTCVIEDSFTITIVNKQCHYVFVDTLIFI